MLFIIVLISSVACGSRQAVSPTPFPSPAGTSTQISHTPVVLTLTELAAAPGLYKDVQLQLTGQFYRQPILVCETETFAPPATWGLVEEGVQIPAKGYDQELRTLLPEGLMMTAEGRWRQWEGIVGCGKSAQPQTIWFFDVSRIISPSPITQVTLTPSSGEAGIGISELPEGGSGTDTGELPGPPGSEDEFSTPAAGGTPGTPGSGFPESTPPVAPYPGPNQGDQDESPISPTSVGLLATPTLEQAGTVMGTPLPGITGTPGTTTPTPPSGTSGPTVEQGDLFELNEEFAAVTISAGVTHSWTADLFPDEEYTIYALAPPQFDLALSALKDGQIVVNPQNFAPAGSPEIMTLPASADGGIYQVLVSVVGGGAAEYVILGSLQDDYPVRSVKGLISPGSPQSNITLPADEVHFWFFFGDSGRNVTIELTLDSQTDPILDFYGPGAEYIDSIDEGLDGQGETYTTQLMSTGLFAIRVSELNFSPMVYSLLVTIQ
ncbi:MAG: hypothetical protein R6X18_08410 [Chloroflexota bacterium]